MVAESKVANFSQRNERLKKEEEEEKVRLENMERERTNIPINYPGYRVKDDGHISNPWNPFRSAAKAVGAVPTDKQRGAKIGAVKDPMPQLERERSYFWGGRRPKRSTRKRTRAKKIRRAGSLKRRRTKSSKKRRR